MSEEVKTTKTKEAKFSIDELASSKKFKYLKDALRVVLEKGQDYTVKEAEDKIEAFMKGGK